MHFAFACIQHFKTEIFCYFTYDCALIHACSVALHDTEGRALAAHDLFGEFIGVFKSCQPFLSTIFSW